MTLDVPPTRPQRRLLQALADGQDLGLEGGRPLLLQSGERPAVATVAALVRRQWLDKEPDYPLFSPTARITYRGRAALKLGVLP